MAVLWLCVISGMLAAYAILGGFDLGSGVIHVLLTRSESERRSVPPAVHPFWDGNEVWLLLAGGALYCAFPSVYASHGFSLAAAGILALLFLRGIGIVIRNRTGNRDRRRVLDMAFAGSSMLIAIAIGIAIGCAMGSGVDGFVLLGGLCGLAVVLLQSASWMAAHSVGALQSRCRRLASYSWWAVMLCYAAITAIRLAAQPNLLDSLILPARPDSWIVVFAILTLAGLLTTRLCLGVGFDFGMLAGAWCVVIGLVGSAAAGQYPQLLNSAPGAYAFGTAWWVPAFLLTAGCALMLHRAGLSRVRGRLGEKTGDARTA